MAILPTHPANPSDPSDPADPADPTEVRALRQLYQANAQNNSNTSQAQQWKADLGCLPPYPPNEKDREISMRVSTFHDNIRNIFIRQAGLLEENRGMSDSQVMQILEKEGSDLKYLLARGIMGRSLLHVLLGPDRSMHQMPGIPDEPRDELFVERLKPLVRFLLTIAPDSLKWWDDNARVPLFLAIESLFSQEFNSLIQFLCGHGERWSQSAIASLGMTGKGGPFTDPPRVENAQKSHALHQAIRHGVEIEESIVGSKMLGPSLRLLDSEGLTCLHKAVMPPETPQKRKWAEMLVRIDFNLLQENNGSGLTPLQCLIGEASQEAAKGDYVASGQENGSDGESDDGNQEKILEQQNVATQTSHNLSSRDEELDDPPSMETWLKLCCFNNFDTATVRRIMYRPSNMRQVDFSLEEGDVVSRASLAASNKHYKLDATLLKIVFIPQVNVKWDENSKAAEDKIKKWNCVGKADYYLIFHWLKKEVCVKQVLKVVVEDLAGKSHSDKAIFHCLKGLKIQTWNWKKLDVSSNLIYKAARTVTEVYLYCSGNEAVLRGWSDCNGLILLKKVSTATVKRTLGVTSQLKTIHLEVNQGLESYKTVQVYVENFVAALEKRFLDVYQRKIVIHPKINKHFPKNTNENPDAAILKRSRDGYEEQEWLKCMDEFADFVDLAVESESDPSRKVKVALIDDGVKSSYDNLDDNIDGGESWVGQPDLQQPHSPYLTSVKGHGTVMAYFIRRVCPDVRLYVLKLDPILGRRTTFSIESVTEAIKCAVREKVDIISMSWAIDAISSDNARDESLVRDLKQAIQEANTAQDGHKVLLFCAWPDKGAGIPNNTYPWSLAPKEIFTIGAASRDGNRASMVGDGKPDFFLPGVKLSIPIKTNTKQRSGNKPPETYETVSGNSVSCALASGLAAMILSCARKVDSKSSRYLESYDGMRKALEGIDMSEHRWLAVNTLFGNSRIRQATAEERKNLLRQIVGKFLGSLSVGTRYSNCDSP